ncbi:MAG: urease accessory UreF family protein [Rhodomicrobium sp.]
MAGRLGPLEFEQFVETQIRCRWALADRVALLRAYRFSTVLGSVIQLDHEVEACTLAEDLRAGSRRNGMAFLTAHTRLSSPGASEYRQLVLEKSTPGHLAVVQGLIWQRLGLEEETVAVISGYQAVVSTATAAVRLGLIGVMDAQAAITRLLPVIREVSSVPIADDEPLSSFIPLTEIALALHRASGQRLFSN